MIQTRATDAMEVEEKSETNQNDTGDKTSGTYNGVGIQVNFPGGMSLPPSRVVICKVSDVKL